MIVYKVKREDSKRVWEIRNHPEVRKVSGSSEEFSFDDHDVWFENKYFRNSENICFILATDQGVIGYCRFDNNVEQNNYTIAIADQYHFLEEF